MSKVKKGFVVTVILMMLILVVYLGQLFMINSHNFYALEANSVEEANSALKDMDILEERNFETKDFYGEYVPGTSFVISYQGRVYYDQGYYMVYKGDYKPVYCIDPLKTAWSVTNKEALDEMNNHNFSNLTSYQQEQVSRIVLATQYLYDTTNEPEYLVAGQLLVWEAIGSVLENYSYNLQDKMDEISNKAAAFDFSDVARGSTADEEDLIYYDTDGQDLIGVPTTPTDPGDPVDKTCDEDEGEDCGGFVDGDITVEKTAELDGEGVVENGQEVTYSVVISNNSSEVMDFIFTDDVSDENLTYLAEDHIVVNGIQTDLTISDMQNGVLIQGLAPGDSVKIEYTVVVDFASSYTEGETITNTAEACIKDTDICDSDIETIGTEDTEIGIAAEKTIEEAGGDGIVQAGEELTFTILVSNISEKDQTPIVKDELNDVNIIYDLDAPVYIDGVESDYTVGDLNGNGVTLPTLAPGEESRVSFIVDTTEDFVFDSSSELLVSNKSQVCAGEDCVGADAYLPVGGFEVEKTVSDQSGNNVAEPNEVLTYNIQIKNYNSEVSDITLKDTMATSLISYDPSTPLTIEPVQNTTPSPATLGALESGLVLNDVEPGAVINISYTVTTLDDIESAGTDIGVNHISNNIEVCNGDECEDDSASITIDPGKPVVEGGDKSIIKSITDADGDGIAEPGEVLTFNVLISNGTDNEASFVVTDSLADKNIEYDLSEPLVVLPGSNGSFDKPSPTVGNLQEGISVSVEANSKFEFTFKASVKDPLEDLSSSFVYNVIEACTPDGCADGGGKIPLDSTKAFEVTKKVTDATGNNIVEENEEFEYEIIITNIGNSISSFYLQDLIDDNIINVNIPLDQQLIIEKPEGVTSTPENPTLNNLVVDAEEITTDEINDSIPGIKFSNVEPGESVSVKFAGVGISNMVEGNYVISNTAKVLWDDNSKVGSDYGVANIYTNKGGDGIDEDIAVKKVSTDENQDGVVSDGEVIDYYIILTNQSSTEAVITLDDMFSDPNVVYNLSDTFTITSSDGNATVDNTTLESLNTGVTITLGADSVAYIKYSGVAANPAVDSSALYNYNIVNYCTEEELCNSTTSLIPREDKTKFEIEKTALKDGVEIQTVSNGEVITYGIIVSNTGNKEIDNLTLNDFKDDNISINPDDIISVKDENGNEIETTPEVITFSNLLSGTAVINHLDIGQKAILNIPATISYDEYSDENALITNIIEVCDEEDTCVVDDATVTADPINKPVEPGAVGVVKEIIEADPSDGVGTPGEGLTFKITISNSYNETKNVNIQDPLDDPNLVYDESSPLIIRPGDVTGYTIGDLKTGFNYEIPAKSKIQIEFQASIASGEDFDESATELTNTVTVCTIEDECSEGGGHITLPSSAGFLLNKTVKVNDVDTTEANLGDTLNYSISVKNVKNTPISDLVLYDMSSQFIETPDQPIDILDEEGTSIQTSTTNDLMDDDGIAIDTELEPGDEIHFSYDANVALDLHGSDVRHLTNMVIARASAVEKTRNNSVDLPDGSMGAVASATVTLDSVYPVNDKFSVLKRVEEEDPDGIAVPGEKLTYTVYMINLTQDNQKLTITDVPDENIDYSSSSLDFENIPEDGISPASPTIDNLFDGTLNVTVPSMQVSKMTYTGVIKNPLTNPNANYVYNDVEACNSEGVCSDTGTEVPLEKTKGFDVSKNVEIEGKTGDVVEEGDVLNYTIKISNNRNTPLENVVVNDMIDRNIPIDLTEEYTISSDLGNTVDVTPSSNTISDLVDPNGITISKIEIGDVITIKFSSQVLGNFDSLEYNNLANIVEVCVANEPGSKNQSIEVEDKLCANDNATVTIDGTEEPVGGLGILKEVTESDASGVSNGVADPGDNLHFKITITNNTSVDDTMVLTDLLDDPNIVYDLNQILDINPSGTVTTPENPTVGNLPTGVGINIISGGMVTVEFDATVASPLVNPTASYVSNEIEVCTPDGDCGDGGGQIILPGIKGFNVQKTVEINGVDPVNPEDYIVSGDDLLKYKITIVNNRNKPLENVVISDVIDDSILVDLNQKIYINGAESSYTAQELFDGEVVIDSIEVGETVTIEYEAKMKTDIESEDANYYTNFVKACSTPILRGQAINTDEGLCGYDSITVTTDPGGIVNPDSKVGIVKILEQDPDDTSVEADMVNPGELLTFTILVYNNTTIDQNILVTDPLDDVNIDYDSVLTNPLEISPVTSLISPLNATVGDMKTGVMLGLPAESYATIGFKVHVKNPLEDTSALEVGNIATACLEDGSDCSDAGTDEILVGNANFALNKKAYYNGSEITDSDIISDGEKVQYEITVQNTGNRALENITLTDLQDDNLIVDYTDNLGFNPSKTDQIDFSMDDLIPANPTLSDLFIGESTAGITIPLLDRGSSITFTYEAVVDIVTNEEIEATNIAEACIFDSVKVKSDAILNPDTGNLCATDYAKVPLKDNPTKDPDIGVVKFALDMGVSDGIVEPGEEINYHIAVVNKSSTEVVYNLSDTLNDNLVYDLTDEVTVKPSDYAVTTSPTIQNLVDGNLQLKIPPYRIADVSYNATLKTIDSGLDTAISYVTNEVSVCREDDPTLCGEGETHIPVSLEKYVGITKEVTSENNLDVDADGILDVTNDEALTYTITVTNRGNTTTDMRVQDDLPYEFVNIIDSTPISPSGGYSTDPAVATVGDLTGDGILVKDVDPGDSFTLTFIANVKTADEISLSGVDYSGYITNIAESCTETNLRIDEKCATTDVSVEYNDPTYPLEPGFTIDKDITDEDGNGDGIAQYGEELTFHIKVINDGIEASEYLISDKFEDVNVDYIASNSNELEKVGGTGEFVGDHLVSNLIDDSSTPIQEGVSVKVDPKQYIDFKFNAKVLDPLADEGKYNSEIINTAYATDVDGNTNYSQGIIKLPVYSRMDINKTYTTDYTYDLDPDPDNVDNIYYVTGPNDKVTYNINYKNIGTSPVSNFEILDYLDKSAYTYDPMTVVTLTSPGSTETITLEELTKGYTYTGTLNPNETLIVSFEVITSDFIEDKEDGYTIPNIAKVCYDNSYTEDGSDTTCKVSGVVTPLDKDGVVERPTSEFTVEKWIEDDNGDDLLNPNEDVMMHILISNNTDEDLDQFDYDAADELIEVTDDLTEPNFVYDLATQLKLINVTTGIDVTNDSNVVNILDSTLDDIDKSNSDLRLTLVIKDGQGIEISFAAKGSSFIS